MKQCSRLKPKASTTSKHPPISFLMKTNLKIPINTQSSPWLTRNSEIVKICEQWENSRVLGSRGALRSLRDAKIIWNQVGRGLAIEYAKTRERVKVSNLRDLKI